MKKLEIKLRHFDELEAIMDREREAVSIVWKENSTLQECCIVYHFKVASTIDYVVYKTETCLWNLS